MILRRQRAATKRPHTYALKHPRLMCNSTREFRYPPWFLIANIHEILPLANPKGGLVPSMKIFITRLMVRCGIEQYNMHVM